MRSAPTKHSDSRTAANRSSAAAADGAAINGRAHSATSAAIPSCTAAKHGTRAASQLLEVAEAVPPADVRAALGLPDGGRALLRRQLLTIDDEPAELVASYYPLEIAAGTAMAERRRITGGTPTLLTELGHPPRLSVDRVSARTPTQEQCRALRLPGNLPVLRTLRVVYSDHQHPIEVSVLVKAGHLYEVQYEYSPEASG